jgi:uncharacterized protein (TIGR03437 family)
MSFSWHIPAHPLIVKGERRMHNNWPPFIAPQARYRIAITALLLTTLAASSAVVRLAKAESATAVTINGVVQNARGGSLNLKITVNLDGAAAASTTTDLTGHYSFSGLTAGANYTITADSIQVSDGTHSTLVFFSTVTITNLPANPGTITPITVITPVYSIAGTVKNTSGSGISGVGVRLDGGSQITTNNNGQFTFPNCCIATSSHDVTYSSDLYTVTPGDTSPLRNMLAEAVIVATATPKQPPTLTSLNPDNALAGSSNLQLMLQGSNFVSGSKVIINGVAHLADFISSSALTTTVLAQEMTVAGTLSVSVSNPDGQTSATLNFTVRNPAPTISTLDPSSVQAGGSAFTLTVNGTNFSNGSTVQWNGLARQTSYVSSTQLNASISAGDIATGGTASVTVVSMGPGGGTSNSLNFTVNGLVTLVSAASFAGGSLAPDSLAVAFGSRLATGQKNADTQPLPTSLLGTSVDIGDSGGKKLQAPLLFVSPNQINYVIPTDTALGGAMTTVRSGDGQTSTGQINIVATAPGVFSADSTGKGLAAAAVLRVKSNGSQNYEQVVMLDSTGKYVALPIDLGPEGDQVFLVIFGTGIRHRSSLAGVTATVGGVAVEVLYAGQQGFFFGLDQVNLRLARSLAGRGLVNVALTVDGMPANVLQVVIK